MLALIAAALGLVFLITRFVIGFGAERLMRLLGAGGLHVVTRVLGILLAALAVQFVLNGIGEFRPVARSGSQLERTLVRLQAMCTSTTFQACREKENE